MLTREQAQAIYRAREQTVVRVLLEMDARIHALEQQVRELIVRLDASEQRVKTSGRPVGQELSQQQQAAFHRWVPEAPRPRACGKRARAPRGGQPGHAGQTHAMAEKPDRTERHRVDRCERCGRSLAGRPPDGIEQRQVHELPHIELIVTEHQAEMKRCSCGHLNKAAFPEGVNAPVQYGPGVKAVAVYLKNYQFLPYERTCELLGDFFGCPMSEGTLANLIGECHARLEQPVQQIKEQIAQAPVAQFDESGVRVEKKLWWLHAASTAKCDFTTISIPGAARRPSMPSASCRFRRKGDSRLLEGRTSVTNAHTGLCNAHHLRELIFVHEQHQQDWADTMIDCLLDIKKAVALAKPTKDHLTKARNPRLRGPLSEYPGRRLCRQSLSASPAPAGKKRGRRKKTKPRNLLERLDQHRQEVLLSCTTSASPSTITWPNGTFA